MIESGDRLNSRAGSSSSPVELSVRALRLRVEAADAVDLVVEQVDAQRRFAAHREDVEQRAADREIARLVPPGDAGVAGAVSRSRNVLEIELLADARIKRVRIDKGARRQALQRRGQIHDHDAALRAAGKRASVRSRCEMMSGCGENRS